MAFRSSPKKVANQCMSDDDAYKMWVELRALHESLVDTRLRDKIQNVQQKVQSHKHQYHVSTSHAFQSLQKECWKQWVEERIILNSLQNMMKSMTKHYHTTLQKMNTKYPNYRCQETQVTLPLLSEDGDIDPSTKHELLIYGYCRYAYERIPIDVIGIIGSSVTHVYETSFEHQFPGNECKFFYCNDLGFQLSYNQRCYSIYLDVRLPEHISECTLLSDVSDNGRFISGSGMAKNCTQTMEIYAEPRPLVDGSAPTIKCNVKILRIKYKNGNVLCYTSTKMKRRFVYNHVLNSNEKKLVCLDSRNWYFSLDPKYNYHTSLGLQLTCLQLPFNVGKIGVKWGFEYKGLKNEKILYFYRDDYIVKNMHSCEGYPLRALHFWDNSHTISKSSCSFFSIIRISVCILTVFDDQGRYIPARDWEKYGIVD